MRCWCEMLADDDDDVGLLALVDELELNTNDYGLLYF